MHWFVVRSPSVFSLQESPGLLQGSHAQQQHSAGHRAALGLAKQIRLESEYLKLATGDFKTSRKPCSALHA